MAEQRLISKLWTEQPELHPYQIVNNGVLVKSAFRDVKSAQRAVWMRFRRQLQVQVQLAA